MTGASGGIGARLPRVTCTGRDGGVGARASKLEALRAELGERAVVVTANLANRDALLTLLIPQARPQADL